MELTYQLSIVNEQSAGKELLVTFALTNNSSSNLWVLTWYTPLEGIKGKIFTLVCGDVELPYEGRMVKRAAPAKDDYLLVKAGETVSAAVDLTTVFQIPETGTCTLGFKGILHDVVYRDEEVPRNPELHESINISGNSLTFHIEHDSAP